MSDLTSDVWIPSNEEYDEMCRLCESNNSNALILFKRWIDQTQGPRLVCKETFCPADSNKNKQVPLVLAANCGNAHIVRYLLTEYSSVIDVNCKGGIGRHFRLRSPFNIWGHSEDVLRTLPISHKLRNVGGITALWATCWWGNREIAQLLLRAGADVNTAAVNLTPMQIAAFNGHCELMELLYSHGADINLRNGQDYSPLMAAGATNQVEAVMFLLEHGADVSQKNAKGYTVFHTAAANDSLAIIRILKQKGFQSNVDLPRLYSVPCPYFIAVNFGYHEMAEELKQGHVLSEDFKSETNLLVGARCVKRKHPLPLPVEDILKHWREAIRLRNVCGYVPEFLPPFDVYAGLSEVVTEVDLVDPPKDTGLDMEMWIRYQSLLIKERIVGPSYMLQALFDSGHVMCERKMFRHAELLWLRFIEYYSLDFTNIFTGIQVPNFKTCVRVYSLGIYKMVLQQYHPDFSRFVHFGLKILSKCKFVDVALESILWTFASWIRSNRSVGEGDYSLDECEQLGREVVSQLFHIHDDKTTLLQSAISRFNNNALRTEYPHLVYALLRWGCNQDLYSVRGRTHSIHDAVRVGNDYHVDIVTPLLSYGCSPLFVDSDGRTALQLATSSVVLCKLHSYSLSLVSMCCVAIVKYGFPYESLVLPSAIKSYIRLFDKKSRCSD